MNSLKYFLLATVFISCGNDLSNSIITQQTQASVKEQIIHHLTNSESSLTPKHPPQLKSLPDDLDTLVYTASYDMLTCQANFSSLPQIESFFIEHHFVFFTNEFNLISISDFQYDTSSHTNIPLVDPEIYNFQFEDHNILVVEISPTINCPLNVFTKFQLE